MIHKVAAPDLQPGMYIVDLNLSPQEFPRVYAQEGLLASAPQIADILQRGYREAFVDDEKVQYPLRCARTGRFWPGEEKTRPRPTLLCPIPTPCGIIWNGP